MYYNNTYSILYILIKHMSKEFEFPADGFVKFLSNFSTVKNKLRESNVHHNDNIIINYINAVR